MVDGKPWKISCKTTYFKQVVVTILNPRFQLSASRLMDICFQKNSACSLTPKYSRTCYALLK
jgi:hypothetical protein